MQISPVNAVTMFSKNGVLLGAIHRVLGNYATKTNYCITQRDIDALGVMLENLHVRSKRLLTPSTEDAQLADLFCLPGVKITDTDEDRIARHHDECRRLYDAECDLRTLYRSLGLSAPQTWED